jgi:plasmid replication initiation protein
VSFSPGPPHPPGARWRVLPAPGDRLPGTFDQDVYVELFRRYTDAGAPADGTIAFTLHAFLRAMGRRVDGRTYEQLRGALTRLERTVLESAGSYFVAGQTESAGYLDERLTLLTAVSVDRRRAAERDQLALFPVLATGEPGEARVTLAPLLRANLAAGHTVTLSAARYFELPSPTARRLYRLLAAVRSGSQADSTGPAEWDVALEALAEQLPLSQRYPSHLQRVLEPAHSLLKAAGVLRSAAVRQQRREWVVHYGLA